MDAGLSEEDQKNGIGYLDFLGAVLAIHNRCDPCLSCQFFRRSTMRACVSLYQSTGGSVSFETEVYRL